MCFNYYQTDVKCGCNIVITLILVSHNMLFPQLIVVHGTYNPGSLLSDHLMLLIDRSVLSAAGAPAANRMRSASAAPVALRVNLLFQSRFHK